MDPALHRQPRKDKGSHKALLAKLTERHALEDTAGELHTLHAVDGLSAPDAMARAHGPDSPASRPGARCWSGSATPAWPWTTRGS